MFKIRKIFGLLLTIEGLFALLSNPWVATVFLPSLISLGAVMMAWAQDLPWLQIYVLFFFVAACVSVMINQILNRWQTTTDRYKLIYQSFHMNLKFDGEGGPIKYAWGAITFQNIATKPMTVELSRFDIRVGNRVPDTHLRKVSKFTIGSMVNGHFSSNRIDLNGLDGDVVNVHADCEVLFGFNSSRPHRISVKLVGEARKDAAGKYNFQLWEGEEIE